MKGYTVNGSWYIEWQLNRMEQQALQQEAAQYRLMKQIKAGTPPNTTPTLRLIQRSRAWFDSRNRTGSAAPLVVTETPCLTCGDNIKMAFAA